MSKKITVQQNQIYSWKGYDYIKYYHVELDNIIDSNEFGAVFYLWNRESEGKYCIPVLAWTGATPPSGAETVVFIKEPGVNQDKDVRPWTVFEDLEKNTKSLFCDLTSNNPKDWIEYPPKNTTNDQTANNVLYAKGALKEGKFKWGEDETPISGNRYYVKGTIETGLRIVSSGFQKMAEKQKVDLKIGDLYVAEYVPTAIGLSNTVFSSSDTENGDIIDFTIKVPEETETNSTQYWGQLIWQIGVDRNGTQVIPYLGTPFHIFKYFHWSVESFGENLGHKLAGNYKINKPYALAIYRTELDPESDKPVIKRNSDYAKQRGWLVFKQDGNGASTETVDDATSIPDLYNIVNINDDGPTSLNDTGIQVRYTILTYDD